MRFKTRLNQPNKTESRRDWQKSYLAVMIINININVPKTKKIERKSKAKPKARKPKNKKACALFLP